MPGTNARLTTTYAALGVLLLTASVAAHFYLGDARAGATGPLLVLDHLFNLFSAAALIGVCLATGQLTLARWNLEPDRPIERLVFGVLAGSGIVAVAILLLGAVGWLRPYPLGLLFLVLAVAGRRELRALPRLVVEAISYAIERLRGEGPLGAALVFLALVGMAGLVLAIAPPTDWDALMYHLAVPERWLSEGRLHAPPDNLHVLHIGLVHALYLPLLALGSLSGPAILSVGLALLLALLVFSFCERTLGAATGAIALVALWGTATILLVAVTPRVDVTLALYLFAAHYALLVALEAPAERRYFLLAAGLLGLAIGVKLNALPYILVLAPLVIWVAIRGEQRLSGAAARLALFGLLAGSVALPWLAKNAVLLSAPLAPFFGDPMLEPWLVPFFGSQAVPDSLEEIFRLVWEARRPFNLRDAFFFPGRLSIEAEAVFYHTSPALLLVPLWLLFFRNRTLNWLLLPAIGYLLLLLTPFPRTNLRYIVPAVVPLTIVVAHIAVRVSSRFGSTWSKGVLLGLALLSCWHTGRALGSLVNRGAVLPHAAGVASPAAYMRSWPSMAAYAGIVDEVNARLESDDRLLMFFEGRGLYFEPPVLQDNRSSNWYFLEHALAGRCLDREVATHILVGGGVVSYFLRGGADPELLKLDALRGFASRCLVPVARLPGFELLEVKGATASG